MSAAQQSSIRSGAVSARLPDSPSLNSLKGQAKQLLSKFRKGDTAAVRRFHSSHPDWAGRDEADFAGASLALSDAQLVVAREYGFDSWPKLKHHVEAAVPVRRGVLSEIRDEIVDEHVDSLARRHAPFAELLRRTFIFQGFSKATEVSVEVTRSTYGKLVASLPNPCCVYTFFADQMHRGEPNGRRGPVVLDVDRSLSGALLDGIRSGSDRYPNGQDDEARTEMTHVVTTILAHFERVWEIHPNLKVTDAELETDPSYIAFVSHREGKSDVPLDVPDEEPVVGATFDVTSPEVSGSIRISYLNRTLQNIVLPTRFAKGKAQHYDRTLEGADRQRAAHLFEDHTRCRVEIDAVLNDQAYGMLVVDDVKNPTIAQATLYDESSTFSTNTWYGGDAEHPILAEWISHPPTGVVPESSEWERKLIEHRGLPDRRVPCYEWDGSNLDIETLERLADRIPEAVRIERVDIELAQRLQDGFYPSVANNFASLEDFVSRGIAFCAFVGDDPALVATTNVVTGSSARLFFKINPHFESERQALSTVASAKLASTCLREGIRPEWWAVATVDNAWPGQVGQRLGFVQKVPYEMLVWDPESGASDN